MMPFYGRNTLRAGVGRPSGMLPGQVYPIQVAFVAHGSPHRPADLSVITPVNPASLRSASPTLRIERLEGFAGDQFRFPYGSEQDQDVRRQVRQVVVSRFVLPPTARDLSAQLAQLPLRSFPSLVPHRQLVTSSLEVID